MSAKRPPPWYRTFASDDLASSSFFGLTAIERGLLDSLARAFWCEGPLPTTPRLLARLCRLEEAEVVAGLTPAVLAHFEKRNGALVHRELGRQRAASDAARAAMSEGGKLGAARANAGRKPNGDGRDHDADHDGDDPKGTPLGEPQGIPKGADMKCNALQ